MAVSLCPVECLTPIPPTNVSCIPLRSSDAISKFVFFDCSVDIVALLDALNAAVPDLTLWESYAASCAIRVTNELVAEKPAPSFSTARTSSCRPDETTGKTNTITFQDFNVDEIYCTSDTFWNHIMANYTRLRVGWFTCSGRFGGIVSDISFQFGKIKPPINTELVRYEGQVSWNGLEEICEIDAPGLLQLLEEYKANDCSGSGN